MLEMMRRRRNANELKLLAPDVAASVRAVLQDLEAYGYRPRLQETFRTLEEQQKKFEKGLSHIKGVGPHTLVENVAGHYVPASRATHVLDDDSPLDPSPAFLASLAIAANKHMLRSGVIFGLDGEHRTKVNSAINQGFFKILAILLQKERGWDPNHIEDIDWRNH